MPGIRYPITYATFAELGEAEIAALVSRGLTSRQIAAPHISEDHAQHILTKLGLPTRTQAAAWTTSREP